MEQPGSGEKTSSSKGKREKTLPRSRGVRTVPEEAGLSEPKGKNGSDDGRLRTKGDRRHFCKQMIEIARKPALATGGHEEERGPDHEARCCSMSITVGKGYFTKDRTIRRKGVRPELGQ